jgi:hypothetical protein
VRRLAPANLRLHAQAVVWTVRSIRATRRHINTGAMTAPALRTVPEGPHLRGIGTVRLVLRLAGARCLVRSLVEQRWRLARGDARDVVVGVRGGRARFSAHAWLEGTGQDDGHREITRIHAG